MGRWTSNAPRLIKRVQLVTGKKKTTVDELMAGTGLSRPVVIAWKRGATFTRPDGDAVEAWLRYFARYFQVDERDLLTFEIDADPVVAGDPARE